VIIGVLLLSKDGYYVGRDGQLPDRAEWDKHFLTDLIRNQYVLCSENTLKKIPRSMHKSAKLVTDNPMRIDSCSFVNFGICTFASHPPHLLLVSKSTKNLNGGNRFDLTRLNMYNEYRVADTLSMYVKARDRFESTLF
jgi:hypothetical protein